jgi:integrase
MNPAADAGPNLEPPPATIRPYTRAELDAIEAELDPRYAPVVPFGAATGLRPEEWAALERRQVDRTRGVVKVEQKNVAGRIVRDTFASNALHAGVQLRRGVPTSAPKVTRWAWVALGSSADLTSPPDAPSPNGRGDDRSRIPDT